MYHACTHIIFKFKVIKNQTNRYIQIILYTQVASIARCPFVHNNHSICEVVICPPC